MFLHIDHTAGKTAEVDTAHPAVAHMFHPHAIPAMVFVHGVPGIVFGHEGEVFHSTLGNLATVVARDDLGTTILGAKRTGDRGIESDLCAFNGGDGAVPCDVDIACFPSRVTESASVIVTLERGNPLVGGRTDNTQAVAHLETRGIGKGDGG